MKGIPKGLCSFGRSHEADSLVQGTGQRPEYARRLAKGELKNSPVDCFSRGNALQEKAFPCKLFCVLSSSRLTA